MLYSKAGGWLFLHVQRTSGTSLRMVLSEEFPDAVEIGGFHGTAEEALGILGRQEFMRLLKFSIMRNPWARLVSWWQLCEVASHDFAQYVQRNASTFDDFLRLDDLGPYSDPIEGSVRVLRPHREYVSVPNPRCASVDMVLKYEAHDRDVRALLEGLGCPERLHEIKPAFGSRQGLHGFKPYPEWYTPESRDLVARAFTDDIRAGGYEFGDESQSF